MSDGPEGASAGASPRPRRQPRPWWRWNLITLAVVLFVLLWVSELTGMRPSTIWTNVGVIFLVWWIAPAPIAGRWPWPLRIFSTMRIEDGTPEHPALRVGRVGMVCRSVAVFVLAGSVVQFLALGWTLSYSGAWYGGGGPSRFVMMASQLLWACLQPFALAVALWTLGAIADSLERQAAHRRLSDRPDSDGA